MTDTFDPVADTERELRTHNSGLKTLVIRRRYPVAPEEIWSAIIDPHRLVRWFLPISGDLRVGGRYSLEGNASGEIVRCDQPRELVVTWEYGGSRSDVRVRLLSEGQGTLLDLEHAPVPPDIIPNASPELWGLGAGWEMGLIALGDYLAGRLPEGRAVDWIAEAPPEELMATRDLSVKISDAWTELIADDRGIHQE